MIVRALQAHDLEHGFLETLKSLSDTGDLTISEWQDIFNETKEDVSRRISVVEENGEIIGTGTLLLEKKFIHAGGLVGHIEDVAVRAGHQGKGVGKKLVQSLLFEAECFGCYKVILDCGEHNASFYESLGFRRHEVCMRKDI